MQKLANIQQSKSLDKTAVAQYNLSEEILMESAGAVAAHSITQDFSKQLKDGLTLIICGPGNNGGDGLVLARHLSSYGFKKLKILLLGEQEKRTKLFNLQLERILKLNIETVQLPSNPEAIHLISEAKLIIDAILGIGLTKDLTGQFLEAVEKINDSKCPIISLDCPTGLDCNSGKKLGNCVIATQTLTFGLAKPGFYLWLGPEVSGKIKVLPIGFPQQAQNDCASNIQLFNKEDAVNQLPTRSDTSNKTTFGGALIIAGQEGMWGAGILASTSAFRVGAGYVIWASHTTPNQSLKQIPEVMTATIAEKPWTHKKASSVAIGPGLGVSIETKKLIEILKSHTDLNVVIDADAITTCASYDLFPLPENWIITPHSGELSRILKCSPKEIDENRLSALEKAEKICGCAILLKGFHTILFYKDKLTIINSGNSALAKAGTGDVLTGMIAGLLAQGYNSEKAAAVASYIHGLISDAWIKSGKDKSSLSASDIQVSLPHILGKLRKKTQKKHHKHEEKVH
ncbi:MAG: NAD(P)H-hydrate dehydratase [Bdellovibrionota bacterium]